MRKFFLFVLFLSSFSTMNMIFAANDKIDIVVVGFTEHGPLQPTIKAIKDVVSKYTSSLYHKKLNLAAHCIHVHCIPLRMTVLKLMPYGCKLYYIYMVVQM